MFMALVPLGARPVAAACFWLAPCACTQERGSGALMLTDCACIVVVVCGWDAAGNDIGAEGAVACAKALESEHCKLDNLNLAGESPACFLAPVPLGAWLLRLHAFGWRHVRAHRIATVVH